MSKILLAVSLIVIFVIGAALGILYQRSLGGLVQTPLAVQQPQNQVTVPLANNLQVTTLKALSSKAVSTIVVYGTVSKIDNRNVTVVYLGDVITFIVGQNSKIYSLVVDKQGKSVQQEVGLQGLKVADNLNTTVKINQEGQLEAQNIFINNLNLSTKK